MHIQLQAPLRSPHQSISSGDLTTLHSLASHVAFAKNAEIWAQGDASPYAYRIVSGCVRLVKLMEDGRRQITAFLVAGDWVGFDLVAEHDYAAEAVESSVLLRYPRRNIDMLMARDISFIHWQLELMSRTLCRAQDRMLTLGRRTAAERIADFLLDMAERTGPDRTGTIRLPMGRTDIGDYLGLRLETVCRVLARLQRDSAIRLNAAGFTIRNRDALEEGSFVG